MLLLGVLQAQAAGAGPYPTENLVAHYNAADVSTISVSGSDVTQWNDISGNGHNATQGTSTNRPKSGTRTINGLNAIDFDGSNDWLGNDGIISSFTGEDKPFTIFCVVNRDTTSNNTIFGWGNLSNAAPYIWQVDNLVAIRDNSQGQTNFDITNSQTTGSKVLTYRTSGTNFTAWIDDTSVIAGDSYNRETLTLTVATIGALRYQVTTEGFLNGLIGELLFYNRELTTNEVTQVQNYLTDKWGI